MCVRLHYLILNFTSVIHGKKSSVYSTHVRRKIFYYIYIIYVIYINVLRNILRTLHTYQYISHY